MNLLKVKNQLKGLASFCQALSKSEYDNGYYIKANCLLDGLGIKEGAVRNYMMDSAYSFVLFDNVQNKFFKGE